MKELSSLTNNKEIQNLLQPMFTILDEKNIYQGIKLITNNDTISICINEDYLSKTNQIILQNIAHIYNNIISYKDDKNIDLPNTKKYYFQNKEHNSKNYITSTTKNENNFILKLYLKDKFTLLGTTIMLSNILQEQDPLNLKINKDKNVFDQDTINRHNHYISSNCPDSKWIHLSVFLNSENPLRKNCYAPLMSQAEINNPEIVPYINLVQSIFNGHNEKEYIKFEMSKENLQKAIDNYYKKTHSIPENILLNTDNKKHMLESNKTFVKKK